MLFMSAFMLLAATAQPLRPVSKWTVAHNAGDCTLSRSFGDAAKPVVFAFKPALTSVSVEVVVLVPANGDNAVRHGKGRITLGPDDGQFSTEWSSGPFENDRRGIRLVADKHSGMRCQMPDR